MSKYCTIQTTSYSCKGVTSAQSTKEHSRPADHGMPGDDISDRATGLSVGVEGFELLRR